MTIRTRNRFIKILFIITILFFFANQAILIVSLFHHTLNLDFFNQFINKQDFILIRYSPFCVLGSLFFQIFYIATITYILYRSFEKTPATEATYVILYLIACLANSIRIEIGLLNIADTYSNLLIACGNIDLFSKLLFPISLLCVAMMPSIEQKQDTDKNIFLILILSIFFAEIIPLNTIKTLPNFSIGYGYKNILNIYEIICIVTGTGIMAVRNYRRQFNQKTTIGYALTAIGITICFNTVNILLFVLSFIFLTLGTYFYFYELHKQYLWND